MKQIINVLSLTDAQLAVIYTLLSNVRLGDSNLYENDVAELMVSLGADGVEDWINEFYDENGLNPPEIEVTCSNNTGFTITIL